MRVYLADVGTLNLLHLKFELGQCALVDDPRITRRYNKKSANTLLASYQVPGKKKKIELKT